MSAFQYASFAVIATVLGAVAITRLSPSTFRLNDFALPGVFLASFSVLVLGGAPWVYARFPGDVRDTYLAVLCVGVLSTVAAAAVIGRLLGRPITAHDAGALPAPSAAPLIPVASAVALCMLGLYLVTVPEIPLLSMLKGGSTRSDLDVAREEALKLIPGSIRYVFATTRSIAFPFLTIATFLEARRRCRLGWWALFIVTFAAALFFAAATLEKSSVGALLITLYIGALLGRSRSLSGRRLAAIGTLGIAFPIFVTAGSVGFDPHRLGDVLTALGRRVFYLPAEVIFRYVEYTHLHSPSLMGRTLPYVSKVIPGGPVAIDNVIYLTYYRSGGIVSGNAGAGYLGPLWVDFGWYGIVVGGMIVGTSLAMLQWILVALPRTVPLAALRAVVIYQVVGLSSTTFVGMVDPLGPGAVWVIGLTFIFLGLASRHRDAVVRVSPVIAIPPS